MADKKDCEGASSRENSVSRISGVDSRYLATLQPRDRKRFQEKLKYVVDGELLEIQNPYETWNAPSWSYKPTAWPEIEFGDLWTYLVEKPGLFTEAKMKAYKSLEAHEYFVSRKVGVIYSREVKEKTGIFILKAEVRPGQAESQNSYLAWIVAKQGKLNLHSLIHQCTFFLNNKSGLGKSFICSISDLYPHVINYLELLNIINFKAWGDVQPCSCHNVQD